LGFISGINILCAFGVEMDGYYASIRSAALRLLVVDAEIAWGLGAVTRYFRLVYVIIRFISTFVQVGVFILRIIFHVFFDGLSGSRCSWSLV